MLNVLDFEKLDKDMTFYDHSKIADLSDIVKKSILMFAEIANRKDVKQNKSYSAAGYYHL